MRKRSNTNPIAIGGVVRLVLMSAILATVTLSYVWMKHQMHALGDHQKRLEYRLDELRTRNQVAAAHLAELTSTASIQRQLAMGRIDLTPINDRQIVRIQATGDLPPIPGPGGGLLPVVNQVAGH